MTIVETWHLMDPLTRLFVVMFVFAIVICAAAIIEDFITHNVKPAIDTWRRKRARKNRTKERFPTDPY